MTRLLGVCGVAAALLVPALPASAQQINLTANLGGSEETPAFLTGSSGIANVAVHVPDQEVSVSLSVFNLVTGSTAGHVHVGPRGFAGPVILDFPIPAGRTGDINLEFRLGSSQLRPQPALGILTIADAIQAIISGNAYVNIHTSQNPAGEIRGQLTVVR
jgi:hypothetical protein